MPVSTGTQFSPEQILEAGRRAESEGRLDYALQFYRHLLDQHRSSREAQFALEALARLEPPRPQNGIHASPHPGNGAAYGLERHGFQTGHDAGPQLEAGRRLTVAPAEPPFHSSHVELPPPVSDYRMARGLTRLATWLGGPMLVLGLACAAVAVIAPGGLAKLPLIGALFASASAGLGLAASGLGMLIGGQCVRALLDMANATRDMALVLRTQAEGPSHPEPEERPRRSPKKKRRH